MENEFIDEENIPLLNDDVDDSVYEDSQAETSFNNDDTIDTRPSLEASLSSNAL